MTRKTYSFFAVDIHDEVRREKSILDMRVEKLKQIRHD